jgi:hypothetical protein
MQTHSRRLRFAGAMLCALLMIPACTWATEAGMTQQDEFKQFQARVDKYLAVQKQAVASVPPVPMEVNDPAVITKHQQQVAEALKKLRPNAMQGEIFTPATRQMLASTIQQQVKGKDGESAKATILGEGNPKTGESPTPVKLAVNSTYPAAAPLSTVPPSVLMALPTLPKDLEFRFVGRDLILRDTRANVIVDFLPNVF